MSTRDDLVRECHSLGIPDPERHAGTLLERNAGRDVGHPYHPACPTCGHVGKIVNECGCDPNNMPTRIAMSEWNAATTEERSAMLTSGTLVRREDQAELESQAFPHRGE